MQVSLGAGSYMIQGTSTKDAEFKITGGKNTRIATFSLAVGKNQDSTTKYANCKAFGRLADYAAHIRKGVSVAAIIARLRQYRGSNTDRRDGGDESESRCLEHGLSPGCDT